MSGRTSTRSRTSSTASSSAKATPTKATSTKKAAAAARDENDSDVEMTEAAKDSAANDDASEDKEDLLDEGGNDEIAADDDDEPEDEVYEVEKIVSHRVRDGVTQFRVKWKGYSDHDNTWEEIENLLGAPAILDAYFESNNLDEHGNKKPAHKPAHAASGSKKATTTRSTTKADESDEDEQVAPAKKPAARSRTATKPRTARAVLANSDGSLTDEDQHKPVSRSKKRTATVVPVDSASDDDGEPKAPAAKRRVRRATPSAAPASPPRVYKTPPEPPKPKAPAATSCMADEKGNIILPPGAQLIQLDEGMRHWDDKLESVEGTIQGEDTNHEILFVLKMKAKGAYATYPFNVVRKKAPQRLIEYLWSKVTLLSAEAEEQNA
ncbi:hypothetical protein AMAG_07893 [Allomyces macrogynus ATCC 38327]|uniref:Chromo domain-containing protein n=1 Tax=Allomyces macrogynus (strain ATCC 38327) TaxID=578462 RepID=A0A0L0SJN7_ALLM3|nr:hypothetical protein AMAG_07893 [Allomyces macrogynus ATCC 38327]|eukprot:KNE62703.1 hypothetical protein AMAG_07893 [Allomyces macrogynus ATCC 38327]